MVIWIDSEGRYLVKPWTYKHVNHIRYLGSSNTVVIVWYGDCRTRRGDSSTACAYTVVGGCDASRTIVLEGLGDTVSEVVALYEELRLLTWIDGILSIAYTVVPVVEHVNLTETSHRHTRATVLTPLVVSEGDIEFVHVVDGILYAVLVIARTYEVGVLVHIRVIGIAEVTPGNGDEVRLVGDIEVTILTVNELTVVHPHVVGAVDS